MHEQHPRIAMTFGHARDFVEPHVVDTADFSRMGTAFDPPCADDRHGQLRRSGRGCTRARKQERGEAPEHARSLDRLRLETLAPTVERGRDRSWLDRVLDGTAQLPQVFGA